MKKLLVSIFAVCFAATAFAQDQTKPAPLNKLTCKDVCTNGGLADLKSNQPEKDRFFKCFMAGHCGDGAIGGSVAKTPPPDNILDIFKRNFELRS